MNSVVRDLLTNCRVTLSCEIHIEKIGMQRIEISEIEREGKVTLVSDFCKQYPGFSYKTIEGICDVAIKIYGMNLYVAGDTFHDDLSALLEKLVALPKDSDEWNISVNCVGSISALGETESFRYINKREEVAKVTSEKNTRITPSDALRIKLIAMGNKGLLLMAVLVAAVGIGIYCYSTFYNNSSNKEPVAGQNSVVEQKPETEEKIEIEQGAVATEKL